MRHRLKIQMDRRAELVTRREEQKARIADDFNLLRDQCNARRIKSGLRPFKAPVDKYPYRVMKAARGRAFNYDTAERTGIDKLLIERAIEKRVRKCGIRASQLSR